MRDQKQKLFMVGARFNDDSYSGIWMFSFSTNKWRKIDYLKFDNSGASAVITIDENYIIIYGGWNKNFQQMDDIYVLDIKEDNQYKLKKSVIKVPKIARYNMLIRGSDTEHELLVDGWVKQLFKGEQFKNMQLI